ncbi:conserved hypothetical protein [Ricinus communis]|uniref:Uncharacterized protein n=1 Tax=Ricinus communis TaxID=3988 RepID=B9S5P4_RICCO|nr:conserved hypothetical protein [Ricinus communis]
MAFASSSWLNAFPSAKHHMEVLHGRRDATSVEEFIEAKKQYHEALTERKSFGNKELKSSGLKKETRI